MLSDIHEKSFHNFSQKSLKYFQKVTNTMDPRSRSSSGSKKEKKLEKNQPKERNRDLERALPKSFPINRRKPVEIQEFLYPRDYYEFDENIEKKNDRAIALTLVNLAENQNFKKIYDIQKIINAYSKDIKDRDFQDISYIVNSILFSRLSEVFKETRKDKIKFSFLLYKMARRIEYQFIKKGETIFRIGEKGEKFYLILKGNIHILKLVQTAEEMKTEDYLICLHKLKKEKDFYRLKKTLSVNRVKYNIEFEQIDQIYELMIRKKLAVYLERHPSYPQIEEFLGKYGKKPADYNLDSQEINSLFNLNTNPKKNSIVINNQRINMLNGIKNKQAFFRTLKKIESSSNSGESNSNSENENEEKIKNRLDNDLNINKNSNLDDCNLEDSILDAKSEIEIEKAIIDNLCISKINLENINHTIDKLKNFTNLNETSLEMLPSTESALALKSFDSSNQAGFTIQMENSNKNKSILSLTKEELRRNKQLQKAKESLIQIYNMDINNINKKFFIQSFIKTQIINDINCEKYTRLLYNLDENKLFTVYEYQRFHTLGEGQFFGDYALEKNTLRTASVITGDEDAHFAVINKKLYYDLIYEEKIKLSNTYKDFLYSSLFKNFVKKADFEKKYFEHFIYEEYPKNHVFVREKEKMQFVYFIFEGSVLLNSRKSYFDILSDIEAFEGLSPDIKAEVDEVYWPIKQLEKSEAFHYKLKLFAQELSVKKNTVRKIVSQQEIIGLENFIFDLPSYSSITVNSNKAAVFKIHFKLLGKLLNVESDFGTAIFSNFAKVKVKNLIHRLFDVKKSFIDILKAKNYNNKLIRNLFEQMNLKNKDVNLKLSLSRKKDINKEEALNYNIISNNLCKNIKSNKNEKKNTNLKTAVESKNATYDEYDEAYHKRVLSDMENMNLKSLLKSASKNSRREENSSLCNSASKSRAGENTHCKNKSLEKYDFFSNIGINQPQGNEFALSKNLSRNSKHINNLKKHALEKEMDKNAENKEDGDIDSKKINLRKGLTIIENEVEPKEIKKPSIFFNKIFNNNGGDYNNYLNEEAKVFVEKEKFLTYGSEKGEFNKNFFPGDFLKFKKPASASIPNTNRIGKCSNNMSFKLTSKKFFKENFNEEFMKKLNESKNYFNKGIPNKLNLIMKINSKNSLISNLTNSVSTLRESNYPYSCEKDYEYYDHIKYQNISKYNDKNEDFKNSKLIRKKSIRKEIENEQEVNPKDNIRSLIDKFKTDKKTKDSFFVTNRNIIFESKEEPTDILKNMSKPNIKDNKSESDFIKNNSNAENSIDIESLSNEKKTFDMQINKKLLTPINLVKKTKNKTINKNNFVNCNFNEVYFNLNSSNIPEILDSDVIKEKSKVQINDKKEKILENKDPLKQNFIPKPVFKGFANKDKNWVLKRLARVVKEKQEKEKTRRMILNKLRPNQIDCNNLSNIKKDSVFSKNNYELFNLGLIGASDKIKNECREMQEKKLKEKARYLSFDKNTKKLQQTKPVCSFKQQKFVSDDNSNFIKYQTANKSKLKSIKNSTVMLRKYELFKPIEKIENTQKAFMNGRSNSKSVAKGLSQNKKKIIKEPRVIENTVTNINLTVVNLIDEKFFDVDLIEKFKDTSKYQEIKILCDNFKMNEAKKKDFIDGKAFKSNALRIAEKQKIKKITLMNLIKNKEIKNNKNKTETGVLKGSSVIKGFSIIKI